MAELQESRTAVISFRVTPTQRRRLELVLQAREGSGGSVDGMYSLFAPAVQELVKEGDGYLRRLAEAA